MASITTSRRSQELEMGDALEAEVLSERQPLVPPHQEPSAALRNHASPFDNSAHGADSAMDMEDSNESLVQSANELLQALEVEIINSPAVTRSASLPFPSHPSSPNRNQQSAPSAKCNPQPAIYHHARSADSMSLNLHFGKGARKQVAVAGVRTWLKLLPDGSTSIVQLERQRIQAELGIQLRDFRVLDALLGASYPSCLLCRERAIVVNMEHIKVIIAADHALINHTDADKVRGLVEELRRRVPANSAASASNNNLSAFNTQSTNTLWTTKPVPEAKVQDAVVEFPQLGPLPYISETGQLRELISIIPFELRVLEVCLEQVASMLHSQAVELEAAMHFALDQLTAVINAQNLERVRRLKSRMVRLDGKVETLREVLQKLLDDDRDMSDMNLTAKQAAEQQRVMARRLSLEPAGGSGNFEAIQSELIDGAPSDATLEEDDSSIVEMLLEAYFMQLESTHTRMQALKQYTEDTEDLINIQLDQHRNTLISIDLLVTFGSFLLAGVAAVAGLLGMNIRNGMENSYGDFVTVCIGLAVVASALFVLFVYVALKRRLITWVF